VREHGQGDVPVPGAAAADLIVIEPGLVLGLGEADERARLQAFLESVSGAFRTTLSDVLTDVADGRLTLASYARARKARDDISILLDGIDLPPAS
jgi:hypothetical protein